MFSASADAVSIVAEAPLRTIKECSLVGIVGRVLVKLEMFNGKPRSTDAKAKFLVSDN